MHCVNYHEPACMQKAGVLNVLPMDQINVFWKHGIWEQAYNVKELIQHFLRIKEKKRPFQGNSMSTLYPDVYEPGTQVGSVFGYHWVKTESWQAPWELLLTQYILNWLIKKSLLKSHSLLLKKFILNSFLHVFLGTPKKVRKISHCSFGISWQ